MYTLLQTDGYSKIHTAHPISFLLTVIPYCPRVFFPQFCPGPRVPKCAGALHAASPKGAGAEGTIGDSEDLPSRSSRTFSIFFDGTCSRCLTILTCFDRASGFRDTSESAEQTTSGVGTGLDLLNVELRSCGTSAASFRCGRFQKD